MELDHVFMFVTPGSDAIDQLAALGLTETYRRANQPRSADGRCRKSNHVDET